MIIISQMDSQGTMKSKFHMNTSIKLLLRHSGEVISIE
jgi:hypothetical protein